MPEPGIAGKRLRHGNAQRCRCVCGSMTRAIVPEQTEALARLSRTLVSCGYSFVTPTPATHARVNARPDSQWARTLRDVFGWSRPFRHGIVPEPILLAMREASVIVPQLDGWRSLVRLSSLDGLAYLHSAYPTEAADAVFFGPDTYRYARALEDVLVCPVRRAVDIGCGAGPGAISIARRHRSAVVYGVDINDAALAMTQANAAVAGVSIETVNSDLLTGLDGQFDLIVANPPYLIDRSERAYRHGGGPLGAGLSLKILDVAITRLAPGGTLLLYTGAAITNGEDPLRIEAEARLAGLGLTWSYRELDPDVFGEELEGGAYVGSDRIAAVTLTVRKQ